MAADRLIPNSASASPVTGPAFMDATQEELTALFNASILTLASVGGAADAITANVTPALTGGVVAGMGFWLVPAATNTGAVTLNIGGSGARAVTNDEGAALAAGQLVAGRAALLLADATGYRLLASSPIHKVTDCQIFTADGTWTKPAGTPDGALVVVELIGAGGGGGNVGTAGGGTVGGGGGGGGAWARREFRAGDLAATVAVTVPAGGALNTAGGNATFGAQLTAYGGGGGSGTVADHARNAGGGGGGDFAAGATGANNTGVLPAGGGDAGNGGGGPAHGTGARAAVSGTEGRDGGGGGGEGGDGLGGDELTGVGHGGRSKRGGGGGGGRVGANMGTGGASKYAGAGGAAGVAGSIPGGGGGAGAAGGRGEARIWTIG